MVAKQTVARLFMNCANSTMDPRKGEFNQTYVTETL